MTTTPHRDCDHPATKSARAKCRKARAAAPAPDLQPLIDAYYAGADLEEIAAQAPRHLARAYYDNSLDAEEFIAALRAGELPAAECTEGECNAAHRTHRILRPAPGGSNWEMVCIDCAITNIETRLGKVDRDIAFQNQGGERAKRDYYMNKLNDLRNEKAKGN